MNSQTTPSTSARQRANALFGLAGKTVLITGASKGIGLATAQLCASLGATLHLVARDEAALTDLQASLDGAGHVVHALDLVADNALKTLTAALPALDGVVHCAGRHGIIPVRMVQDAFLHEITTLNYHVPFLLTRNLLQKNLLNNGASLVFLSSISATTGTTGLAPYASTKAALLGMMRPLALEIARKKMRANALCPALVATAMIQDTLDDPERMAHFSKFYPFGLGKTRDIAQACVFFLSDASAKITGTAFAIDGGVRAV